MVSRSKQGKMATNCAPNPLTQPPIITTLFKFLSGKALCNAASVCKLWKSEAETCLRQRRQYCWQLFEVKRDEQFLETLQHYIEEKIPFRPTAMLVFMTIDLRGKLCRLHGKKRKLNCSETPTCTTDWKGFTKRVLPSHCQVFYSITPGIVGTFSEGCVTKEAESGMYASVLCFGQYPGLNVSLLQKDHEKSKCPAEGCSFSQQTDLKLLLLLSDYCKTMNTMQFIRAHHPDVFIVGGVTTETEACHPPTQHLNLKRVVHMVAFQSTEMQMACVKLDEKVNKNDKVEQAILKLKDKTQGFPLERSVAFMFACVARGYYFHGKDNVESAAFRKHFPSTPLLGFFGNGELGCEFPYVNETGHKNVEDLMHSYTTFLAVVCLP